MIARVFRRINGFVVVVATMVSVMVSRFRMIMAATVQAKDRRMMQARTTG